MPFAEVKLISIFNITSKYLILYSLRNVTVVVTVTLLLFVTLICYVNLLEMKLSTTECVQCKKTFEPKNKRNIYCSDGCKQEAYRIRNNIETPNFLKTQEEKFHVFKSENKTIVYRDVYTKEYTDKRKKIKELNISEVSKMSIQSAYEWFSGLPNHLTEKENKISNYLFESDIP